MIYKTNIYQLVSQSKKRITIFITQFSDKWLPMMIIWFRSFQEVFTEWCISSRISFFAVTTKCNFCFWVNNYAIDRTKYKWSYKIDIQNV